MPGVPWRIEFSKIFKFFFFQNSKNAQNCSKNVSKHVLNLFWVKFFEIFFAQCSMEGRVFENFQIFFSKFQKGPKSFPKVSKRVLNLFWVTFVEIFFAQCSVEGRVFENFQKNIFFRIPKMPKSVLKSIQTCFEHVLGKIFRKNFLPSVPWRVEFSKIFDKKIFSKFQKCPKVFPKVSKRVLNMFWGNIFEKFYAQCSMEGRVFENFPKNQKNSQNSKNAQKCSQKYPNVF